MVCFDIKSVFYLYEVIQINPLTNSPIPRPSASKLASEILLGKKEALARAITLVESQLESDKQLASQLFALLENSERKLSNRIGITGVPGVGKSTIIEAIGLKLVAKGFKVAVLSIDPSSAKTKGSLLGDKSRMDLLSREKNAFIRPSPTGGYMGGIARKTRACITLCEAAGFDWIIVETVGAGQNEFAVSMMVDLFVLLLLPAGGDELQGIKRGVMEMADAVLVNKADGDLQTKAELTLRDYSSAIQLMPKQENGLPIHSSCISALTGQGLDEFIAWLESSLHVLDLSGWLTTNRMKQNEDWFMAMLKTEIFDVVKQIPENQVKLASLQESIKRGGLSPELALESFLKQWKA